MLGEHILYSSAKVFSAKQVKLNLISAHPTSDVKNVVIFFFKKMLFNVFLSINVFYLINVNVQSSLHSCKEGMYRNRLVE